MSGRIPGQGRGPPITEQLATREPPGRSATDLAAADIEPVSSGNHDVQQEKRGRLPLGIGDKIGGSQIRPDGKPCRFQVMLHKAGNISVIFQHKYGLAQPVCLARRPLGFGWIKGRTESLTDYCIQANKLQTYG